MHSPKKFQQTDLDRLKSIIVEYPFATLVTLSDNGLEADHIPFVLSHVQGADYLQGHIAKVNPVWQHVQDHSEVLVIFSGPNCYVSPNHYPTKKEHGKVVPTWNYIVVHVKGVISFIHDPGWNLKNVTDLTNQFESELPEPWAVTDAPESFIQRMLPAIVGVQIEIHSIKGQWKLSQNQPEQNRQGVIAGLAEHVDQASRDIAGWVKAHSGE